MTKTSNNSPKSLVIPLLIATACLIGTACWVLASGDNLPGKPSEKDKPVVAENVTDFATLYATNCAACHGANGKSGPAPPLNDPLFREIVPQNIVEQVVSDGRPGTPMPGVSAAHGGTLTAAQIQVLVQQIKGSSDAVWGSIDPAPPDAPLYLAAAQQPARTSKEYEAIRAGLFARACAKCHGENGEGTATAGAIDKPDFLRLASDPMLRRVIITGRPDLGMPDYRGMEKRPADFKPLTSAEIDDLVALLAQWRKQ